MPSKLATSVTASESDLDSRAGLRALRRAGFGEEGVAGFDAAIHPGSQGCIAGWDIAKGRASSLTEASPARRRVRMARRVGSASAAKVAFKRWMRY
jgi:hypothetical protein